MTEPTQPESKNTDPSAEDFARQAHLAQPGLLAEFWDFLLHNKKWWLAPIIVVLLLVSVLVIMGGSAAAPFIYTLF
ncbi:MAG: DUF5989 family protein [Phycisphaerae bacterium]